MSLPIQKGFWKQKIMGDSREKLADLYLQNPDIAKSEKLCVIEYWEHYDNLTSQLGDNWPSFKEWFISTATSPETITRSLRALKEDGTIALDPESKKQRQRLEQEHRQYWAQKSDCNLLDSPESLQNGQ